MKKRNNLSPETRAQVLALRYANVPAKEIAKLFGISLSTVYETNKRFLETGTNQERPRTGRPQVFDQHTSLKVKKLVNSNPFMSANEIRNDLMQSGLSAPARRTINHILTERLHLRAKRPAKKPLLTSGQRSARLAFCREMLQKQENYWNQVMWSDESMIQQFRCCKNFVRRPPNMRYNPQFTVPTVKHPVSVMLWGAFSAKGRGPLYILPKNVTMNGERYLQILKEKLPNFMRIHKCGTFQHDGAPCHRAAAVKSWLQDQKYEQLHWPGNSADLNPIENLWDIVKDKVADKKPGSLQELTSAIKEVWVKHVTPELCKKLASSVPNRLRAVVDKRGFGTKY
jgi:transposase